MVARITISESIKVTLNYNEKKVQKGAATCIAESGFLLPLEKMNFYHKLNTFENRNKLNERATTNTLHVSLNFDPSENHPDEKLKDIASAYMDKIGFGDQPYLIYRHTDAGHPHIHIISTCIKPEGSRINTHNIGRNQSEKARKDIEKTFGLVAAEKQPKKAHEKITPVDLTSISYGKIETKKAITAVLGTVYKQYNYTSLPEFNAALKQFNVIADNGKENGFIHRHRGLLYSLIDANGNKVGVPTKASAFYMKPTLQNLEKRFEENKITREPLRRKIKFFIDKAILQRPSSIKELSAYLFQKNIHTVLRQNAEGRLYGITFVDNANKCVFNGSEIGKSYSVAGLLKQINNAGYTTPDKTTENTSQYFNNSEGYNKHIESDNLFGDLITPLEEFNPIPYQLKKKKSRKKK